MSSDLIPKFYGKIINGVRYYNRPEQYRKWMSNLEGKEFEEVIIEKPQDTTDNQHAYYRVVVRWLCNETEMFAGWDEKVLHKYIMDRFMSIKTTCEIHYNDGTFDKKEISITPSMAELSKKATTSLIEKLLYWLGENEIYPPEPDQVVTKKYKTKIIHEKPKSDSSGQKAEDSSN
jgi:hypothetical protein